MFYFGIRRSLPSAPVASNNSIMLQHERKCRHDVKDWGEAHMGRCTLYCASSRTARTQHGRRDVFTSPSIAFWAFISGRNSEPRNILSSCDAGAADGDIFLEGRCLTGRMKMSGAAVASAAAGERCRTPELQSKGSVASLSPGWASGNPVSKRASGRRPRPRPAGTPAGPVPAGTAAHCEVSAFLEKAHQI